MSKINDVSKLSKLIGKNVLILDLETTGFPVTNEKYTDGKEKYHNPKKSDKYDNSRIVSIAYMYIPKFTFNKLKNLNQPDIKYFLRKPKDFFEIANAHIHGISYENALKNGVKLGAILNEMSDIFTDCDYVVGHNILFDSFILLNEMWRLNFVDDFEKFQDTINNGKYVCTGRLGENICRIPAQIKWKQYKTPKLGELYKYLDGGTDLEFHNAKVNVYAVMQILYKMYNRISDDLTQMIKIYDELKLNHQKITNEYKKLELKFSDRLLSFDTIESNAKKIPHVSIGDKYVEIGLNLKKAGKMNLAFKSMRLANNIYKLNMM